MRSTQIEPALVGSLLVFFALAPGTASAHIVNYTFCAQSMALFHDNDSGEDEWTTDANRPIGSAWFDVSVGGCPGGAGATSIWSGYLNSAGCTPSILTSEHSCVWLSWWSYGNPAGNTLESHDFAGSQVVTTVLVNPTDTSATVTVAFPSSSQQRNYATLAHIINNRFRGNMSGKTIKVFASSSSSVCGCLTSLSTRACEISQNQWNLCIGSVPTDFSQWKNVIAHEYGHAFLGLNTSNSIAYDCSLGGGASTAHALGSQELMSCAFTEGFADFVAVDAWNNDTENGNPGGKINIGSASVNCNGFGNPETNDDPTCPGSPDNRDVVNVEATGCNDNCVTAYMEANYPSSGWPGRGTEVDWMRMFWDYHTNDPGAKGFAPSHAAMMAEISAAGTLGVVDSYDRLRQGVATQSGCTQYQRFVYYAAANGIDHCNGACDNVSGCADCDSSCCGWTPCP